jgi:hypothetical protein
MGGMLALQLYSTTEMKRRTRLPQYWLPNFSVKHTKVRIYSGITHSCGVFTSFPTL